MNAILMTDEGVFDATINAVIIYDRFDLAAKANAMLERVAHRTGETVPWLRQRLAPGHAATAGSRQSGAGRSRREPT